MTSGRRLCTDCGRNSPQGRHASCHVLALLSKTRFGGYWTKTDLLRAVYPDRWAQKLPGEWPNVTPIDGCIATLRKQGHTIVCMGGMVWLKRAAPAPHAALSGRARP